MGFFTHKTCHICKGRAVLIRFSENATNTLCDSLECDRKWRDKNKMSCDVVLNEGDYANKKTR